MRIMRVIIITEQEDNQKKGAALLHEVREVEKKLLADGWYQVSQKGSHHQYKHPTKPGKVTVPEHGGDLNMDTVKSIMRQAGI